MTTPSALVQNYRRSPVAFVRGAGCALYDAEGKRYLEAFAGVAVSSLGHGHPELVAAIQRQAAGLIHASNYFTIAEQEELAQRIVASAFPGKVLFGNSGAEANEAALKVSRLWANQVHGGRKPRVIACHGSFHGRTMGAVSLTATAAYREPFAPCLPCEWVPYNDVAALEKSFGDDVAAFFVEPVQGESGVHPASADFLRTARALCDRHHALLVMDEIQTGVGRTGTMWGWQQHGVQPDIQSMAKGLAGGVPIGAVLLREELAELVKPGTHGSTFGGNPLACAAGNAVLRAVAAPGFLEHVRDVGSHLRARLEQRFGAARVRGQGLMLGVQLDAEPMPLVHAALAAGLVVGPAGGNTLRILPPLICTRADADELMTLLDRACTSAGYR